MSIEAMKQALEALEIAQDHWRTYHGGMKSGKIDNAIASLRQAIEQYEKLEPIAYITGTYGGRFTVKPLNPAMVLPLNMALYPGPQPQQKPEYKMNDEKLLRLALEAIERGVRDGYWNKDTVDVSTAIQKRLFQPTPQPQREWVGLTEEELEHYHNKRWWNAKEMAREVEAKLRSKNT